MSRRGLMSDNNRTRRQSRLRATAVLSVLLAACLAIAACGSGGSSTSSNSGSSTSAGGGKQVRIAYLLATEAAGYPNGMKAAAQAVESKYNTKIQFFDAQFDPAKQVSQCQDAISSGRFDAIIALPAASPPMIACARQAAAKHIPLISTNTPIGTDLKSFTTTVPGVDSQVLIPAEVAWGAGPNDGAGQLLPAMCADKTVIKGTCDIAYLIGNRALALTTPAIGAVSQMVKQHGWKLAGSCEGNYQRGGGLKCMQDLLQKDPNINVVLSMSDDMAAGAEPVLAKAGKVPGKNVLVGTQGGSTLAVQRIRASKWFGSILSLAQPEGAIPVQLAADVVRGKQIPKFVDPNKATGLPLVLDQQNKDKFPDFKGQFHV